MGQQQLILLVICVVLVGLAVMASFAILETNYRKDEADGLLERSLAIATQAAYWKAKNDPFAGGNQSYEPLKEGGMQRLALDSVNVRGRFSFTDATPTSIEVTGISDRIPGIGVRVFVTNFDVDSTVTAFDGSISFD
jgi:hypothetical protein